MINSLFDKMPMKDNQSTLSEQNPVFQWLYIIVEHNQEYNLILFAIQSMQSETELKPILPTFTHSENTLRNPIERKRDSNPQQQLIKNKSLSPTTKADPNAWSTPFFQENIAIRQQQQSKEAQEEESSGVEFFQNLSIQDLVNQQVSSERRKDDLQKLQLTVKQIKSSEGYRQELLSAYEGKTAIKLQNSLLKKNLEVLAMEKSTWLLQRQQMHELLTSSKSQEETVRQNQTKLLKKIEQQKEDLERELEFQRRRSQDLQKYNKELFAKITNKSSQEETLDLFRSREKDFIEELARLRMENLQLSETAKKYQKDYEHLMESYNYLKVNLQSLHAELGSTRSNYKQPTFSVKAIKSDFQVRHKQHVKKLQQKNSEIIDRQQEINYLKKQLQEEKNNLVSSFKQNSKLKNSIRVLNDQLMELKDKSIRLDEFKMIRSERNFSQIELQHKVAELSNLLAHERLIRQQLGLELKKQEQICIQLQRENEELNQRIVRSELSDNDRVIELSNLLLSQQEKMKSILGSVSRKQEQLNSSKQKICELYSQNLKMISILNQKETQINQLIKKIGQFELRIVNQENKINELENERSKLERVLGEMKEKHERAMSNIQNLQKELAQQKNNREEAENNLRKYIEEINQSLMQKTAEFTNQINAAGQKNKTLEEQLQSLNQLYEDKNINLKEKQAALSSKSSVLDKLNALVNSLNNKIIELEQQNRKVNFNFRADTEQFATQIKNANSKIKMLELELTNVSSLCENRQANIKQQQALISNKTSVLQRLNKLIEDLNNKISLLEEENELLKTDLKQEQSRNQGLSSALLQKNIELAKHVKEIERISTMLDIKSSEYQAENNLLRLAHSKSEEQLNRIQDKNSKDTIRLQEEISRLKLTEKRFLAAEQTLRNLYEELGKSEMLWKEMGSYPSPNGLKKFINLMNNTHKQTFTRQVDKVLEYFSRIDKFQEEIEKHYKNMKVIFSLIDQSRYFFKEQNSPKKSNK